MSNADEYFADKRPIVESERLLRIADSKAKAGKIGDAFRIATRSLIEDPTTSKADWLLLSENPKEFRARRDIFRLISLRLEHLRENAARLEESSAAVSGPRVFIFWGQGFDQAPPLVQKCLLRAQKVIPESRLVVLNDTNLLEWIDLPPVILAAREVSYAAYSDYIRFALLARYGGIWMDATCYCNADPADNYEQLISGKGFFAFDKKQHGVISSWFLASNKGNYITELNRLAQILYWSVFDEVNTYFFAHQIFRTLVRLDSRAAFEWDGRYLYPGNPRILHRSLKKSVGADDFSARLNASFVHKLTYKLSPDDLAGDTGYKRFMSLPD